MLSRNIPIYFAGILLILLSANSWAKGFTEEDRQVQQAIAMLTSNCIGSDDPDGFQSSPEMPTAGAAPATARSCPAAEMDFMKITSLYPGNKNLLAAVDNLLAHNMAYSQDSRFIQQFCRVIAPTMEDEFKETDVPNKLLSTVCPDLALTLYGE